MWNAIIVGIIIATIAAMRLYGARRRGWLSWVNAALGVWLILSPFFSGVTGNHWVLWNFVIVGIIVAVLRAWSALATELGLPMPTEF